MLKPHIVILGAGFGGVYTAKNLIPQVKKGAIDLTIINRTNYFLFTPLLHEVATGSLGPSSVAEPLREIFAGTGISIIEGDVENIDMPTKVVKVSGHEIEYDYLIVATGAETNYYGIPGADRFTMPLKSLADAAAIRSRVIDAFEQAMFSADQTERARLLSFVVIGGGPTGVETVAELEEFVCGMARRYYGHIEFGQGKKIEDDISVTLVHTGLEILPQFMPKLRAAATEHLRRKKIKLLFGKTVTAVSPKSLAFADSTTIPAGVVVWAAGVKPIIPRFSNSSGAAPILAGGRLVVDAHFRLSSDERIFVLGDAAGYTPPAPFLAQIATAQAKVVAGNVMASIRQKPLKPFAFALKGSMVSIGQRFAIGQFTPPILHRFGAGQFALSGFIAWWMWRTVYLFKFASWKKRLRIMADWTFELFWPRDITRLS